MFKTVKNENNKKKSTGFISGLFSSVGLFRLSLFLVLYIIVFFALTMPYFTAKVSLKEGAVAKKDIISPVTEDINLAPWFLGPKTSEKTTGKDKESEVFYKKLRQGLPIVYKGETITAQHILIFKTLGIYSEKQDGIQLLAIACFELILFLFFFTYMYFYRKNVFKSPKSILLISIIISLTLVLARSIHSFSGYIVPVPAAAMLLVILVDGPIAILSTLLISVLVGFIYNFDLAVVLMLLLGSFMAISRSTGIFQRTDLTKAGFLIGGINALVITLSSIMEKQFVITDFLPDLIWGASNGIFSAIFVVGTLPYWESIFRIVTPVRLGELANPNQPLLKRLLVEAPGTYYHSLIVANMAESAAEVIGANSHLARVGGYYHDIGKLQRPSFFVENQVAGDSPHDKITPRLSTLIILSHPRDGIALAEQYQLPEVLIDIIAQHHGTSMVSFFYRQYQANEKNVEKVDENEFRYDGPIPKTKEATVVMLADSIEAAVRSIERPTPHKIDMLIRKIFKDKMDDGQLDNSHLTLRDLTKIRDTFLYVLGGRFHNRVEYPEKEITDEETLANSKAKFDVVGD
jgi:cyclic-di-AMP phosphodiesterase PgpH